MHIAFLTLFLGLTSGAQPFELSVSGPVASVEILLDGTVAQRLDGPPWRGEIDFGPDLAPHELVARALDASGKEIARARQGINLARPPAEVEIALEDPRTVRLSWERLTHEPPVQTSLTLDGQELQLDDQHRASLPSYDPGSTHVLTAELRFPRLEPAAVRAYLTSLGVPLYVWPLKDPFPAWEAPQFPAGLKVDMDLQRILWVEGRHLAREVRLAPEVTGLELLAR